MSKHACEHCCPEANRFNFNSSRNTVGESENGEIVMLSEVNSMWSVPFIVGTLPHPRKLPGLFSEGLPFYHTLLCFPTAGSSYQSHLLHLFLRCWKGNVYKHDIHSFPLLETAWNVHKSRIYCKRQCLFTNSLVPPYAVPPTLDLICASCCPSDLQMALWADGLEVHPINMQQRRIHGFALLQLPGSAEMSKTCYSPFGNMLWLLINANSLLSTVIYNYFSVTKWLTTISTSGSGAKSIP